jgi:hypothetical protein
MKYTLLILYFWVFSINAQEALTTAQWRDILSGSIPTYKKLSIKSIALYHQGQLLHTYQLSSTPEGYLKITTPERICSYDDNGKLLSAYFLQIKKGYEATYNSYGKIASYTLTVDKDSVIEKKTFSDLFYKEERLDKNGKEKSSYISRKSELKEETIFTQGNYQSIHSYYKNNISVHKELKNEVIHKYDSVVRNQDRKELYRLFYYRSPDSLYKRESFGEVDSIREYVFKKDLLFSEKLYCKGLDPLQKGYIPFLQYFYTTEGSLEKSIRWFYHPQKESNYLVLDKILYINHLTGAQKIKRVKGKGRIKAAIEDIGSWEFWRKIGLEKKITPLNCDTPSDNRKHYHYKTSFLSPSVLIDNSLLKTTFLEDELLEYFTGWKFKDSPIPLHISLKKDTFTVSDKTIIPEKYLEKLHQYYQKELFKDKTVIVTFADGKSETLDLNTIEVIPLEIDYLGIPEDK